MPINVAGNIISDVLTREYEYYSTTQYGLIMNLDASIFNTVSGTQWSDLSGNGNFSTLNGPTFDSSNQGSFSYDGSNDTVTNTTLDLRRNWSLEMWINSNSGTTFYFFGQGPTVANQGLHIWQYNSTSLRFGMYSNDTDLLNTAFSSNTWYQYVFTYNHSSPYTKQIYRNGTLMSSSPVQTQSQYAGTGTVRVGSTYSSGGYYSNGKISICRLYDRILTPGEVAHNFNVTRYRYGL